MPSMQTSDVTAERLQRLATFEAPGSARVLSLYLNLDPAANLAAPVNRRTAVTSLLDEAHRAVEGLEGLDHDTHKALRRDVARAREALAANLDDGWAEGAHALALFVCGPADLLEAVKLARPVAQRVFVADRPVVAPLAELGPVDPWAVLLVDGDDARLLEGRGDRLVPTRDARSDSIFEEAGEFLGGVAEMLRQADDRQRFARIAVGTSERHFGELRGRLAEPVRERIIGRFDAGADWESPQAIRAKVEPLLQVDETRREKEAIDAAFTNGVRGLVDTLPALYERRVGTLLLEPGREHPGRVCPQCRWAVADERATCPVDGTALVAHPNLAEWAVELAVEQDATVLPVRHHDDLSAYDGIAAALRF